MSAFFIVYAIIVVLFWIYLIVMGQQKIMRWSIVLAWMVSGANIIGFILYLILHKRFLNNETAD